MKKNSQIIMKDQAKKKTIIDHASTPLLLFFLTSNCLINLCYASEGNTARDSKRLDSMAVIAEAQQQKKINITGTVLDVAGVPVVGASIIEAGTTNGTITDTEGGFSLDVGEGASIRISCIGYAEQTVPTAGKTRFSLVLEEDAKALDEVVVVGYGTQKKVNLTGAVGVADSERLENRTITSLGQGLQGVIPGLNISYSSGDPDEAADYNIRGFESINGGAPLILVDGVPMDIEKVNPNDVKSVSVLKDASSAAIYGARAAFGVILVETKRGEAGKPKMKFSAQWTLQKAIFPGYEPVTAGGTARKIFSDAYKLTTGKQLLPQEVIDAALAYQEMENPTPDDAWLCHGNVLYPLDNTYMKDLAMRDFAPQRQYDFNVSGASERASYYVSLGIIDKEGFFRYGNEKYNRYNALSNIRFKINDWISLEEKISFTSVENNLPHNYNNQWYYQSIAKHFYSPHTFPDLTYYVEPGDHDKYAHLIGMHLDNRNPLPYLKKGGRDVSTQNDIWLTQGVTISPFKGFSVKGDFSYRYSWANVEKVQSRVDVLRGFNGFEIRDNMVYQGESAKDYIENFSRKNTYYLFNAYAEYSRQNIDDHDIKIVAGFNQEYGNYYSVTARSTQLMSPDIHSLTATRGIRTNTDTKNELMLRGLFYRINYAFKDRYLFELNGRYDGTSRFPAKSRFGFFPSFSLGWRLSEEPFMKGKMKWLSQLKVRASYGELGNQSVGSYYPYFPVMQPKSTKFLFDGSGNLPDCLTPEKLVSSTLTWETVVSKNVGMDLNIRNGLLDVSFDYFIRDTKNMLMKKNYPETLGAAAPDENAADLRNRGWELALSSSRRIGDWFYRVSLSLSDYQTVITKYDNPSGSIDTYYVGKKIGEIWGYQTIGLFQTEEELADRADQSRLGSNWRLGDVHYADLDGDGVISTGSKTLDDTGDLIRIGNSTPRYAFGLNTSVKYKRLSLDLFFQGILKKDWYPSRNNFLRFWPFKSMSMEQWWIDDSWTPEHTDAYFPLMQYAYSDNKNTFEQTRYLQNAAYIRLKNITLTYDLPFRFIANAQIYLNGTNLWEATGMYKTLDPEYSADLQPKYMFHRSFTIGLKVTF